MNQKKANEASLNPQTTNQKEESGNLLFGANDLKTFGIIDADARQAIACVPRSCSPVIDADGQQARENAIRPRVCEDVIVA